MIKRIVRLHFKGASIQIIKNFLKIKVEGIRSVDGCSHLEIWQDINDPSIMFSYSYWDSEDHLNTYRKSEFFGTVWPFLKSHFQAPPLVSSFEVVL